MCLAVLVTHKTCAKHTVHCHSENIFTTVTVLYAQSSLDGYTDADGMSVVVNIWAVCTTRTAILMDFPAFYNISLFPR